MGGIAQSCRVRQKTFAWAAVFRETGPNISILAKLSLFSPKEFHFFQKSCPFWKKGFPAAFMRAFYSCLTYTFFVKTVGKTNIFAKNFRINKYFRKNFREIQVKSNVINVMTNIPFRNLRKSQHYLIF